MKRVRRLSLSGQGTLEYILLTTVVIGVVLTIFNGPLRRFLNSYRSRQTQYTDVMSQRKMGIPLQWFGGNYPNPGGPSGGNTAGAAPSDADPGSANAPSTIDPGQAQAPNANGGDPQAGDTAGGEGPTGYAGPGGAGARANNSLLKPSDSSSTNTARRSGRNRGEGDGEGPAGEDSPSGSGGIGATGSNTQSGADVAEKDKVIANETAEERETRIKRAEAGDAFKQAEELYGPKSRRLREGSCGDLDMKVILQIAFVIALFFLLASMLFQKRGRGD